MSTTPPPASAASLDNAGLEPLLAVQRAHAPALSAQKAPERIARLRKIEDYLTQPGNVDRLVAALEKDFRKHEVETLLTELGQVLSHVRYIKKHLRRWMEPERLPTPLAMLGTRSYIHHEAKGVALIIAPWNYPFSLTLIPLLYAIAAGCAAVVKPSELSPATTDFIDEMLSDLFEEREIKVVQGEGDTAAYLTTLPFDHIFFTGSPAIGKKVMAAAAANLTSVTLELGGKSPAVVDQDVNLEKSAANTIWGKCVNAGQTCIAPDYLLVHQAIATPYVAALGRAITRFYGSDVQASKSLPRIISERHFDRIKALLDDAIDKGATVAYGGQVDRADRFIAPTILTNVNEDMRIMQEEIFGPLLPVITYQRPEEALEIINRQEKALAFYVQSHSRSTVKTLLAGSSSGGAVINDYLIGGGSPVVPFGGVNNSGIGKSFGHRGFIEFTNERPVVERRFLDLSMAYPPYTDKVVGLARRIFTWI
ncbi:aldehyde dehydrogenase family protein [Neolewinella lacunae]|uniref:Aldehyde dehydrogenase n=1 Tax=Neolewinella lacunae TaxID=1517758 RepID=A0A923PIZ1_9BACT|nr:aldehyde dehydrogenase family protein [Neolewinella lacunae]MBC6994950.1 aldehyde dehydrogenase family protein [Neolewinella lacunae]MDN3633279.1 aldehyde dehydrogenase family protein [Neolewinella lacunae]